MYHLGWQTAKKLVPLYNGASAILALCSSLLSAKCAALLGSVIVCSRQLLVFCPVSYCTDETPNGVLRIAGQCIVLGVPLHELAVSLPA